MSVIAVLSSLVDEVLMTSGSEVGMLLNGVTTSCRSRRTLLPRAALAVHLCRCLLRDGFRGTLASDVALCDVLFGML